MKAFLLAAMLVVTAAAAPPPGMPAFTVTPLATPAEPDAVALPAGPPGPGPAEQWATLGGDLGGQHVAQRIVRNVARPTITPVLPDPARATGAAVVVAPGGAFLSLSIDSEGFAVAHWLADHGIAAFVLKYRLNPTPADDAAFMALVGQRVGAAIARGGDTPDVREPRATADALAALRLVRARAAGWHVDPARVGMIGFSAGAMTVLQTVLTGAAADRPAFAGYIYGPMTAVDVPADAPPLFAALALDDGLFGRQGFGLVEAWHRAGRPVELHAYERGDHGFGVGRPGTTTTGVMPQFRAWLDAEGLLRPAAR